MLAGDSPRAPIGTTLKNEGDGALGEHRTGQAREIRRPLESLLDVPFSEGNEVRVLRNGAETFPAMLAAIRGATRSVDLLSFIWHTGAITRETAGALAERSRAGVRVRVLLDGFGAQHIDRAELEQMRAAGCQVVFHRPLRTWRVTTVNRRMHQGVLVCDEEVGLTGGTGIDQLWTGDAQDPDHWRDTAVLVRGPAVAGLRATFVRNWLQTPHHLMDSADRFPPAEAVGDSAVQVVQASSGPGWNEMALATLVLLRLARRRVRIATPYVRLSDRFHGMIRSAVARGVQVQIVLTGPHPDRPFVQLQSQRHWQRLLRAGVELWLYQPSFMHAKVITVDECMGMVGTANLDLRSFTLNQQIGLLVDDPTVTATLDDHFDDDLARSDRLLPHEWRTRGIRQRGRECVADLAGAPLRGIGGAALTGRQP